MFRAAWSGNDRVVDGPGWSGGLPRQIVIVWRRGRDGVAKGRTPFGLHAGQFEEKREGRVWQCHLAPKMECCWTPPYLQREDRDLARVGGRLSWPTCSIPSWEGAQIPKRHEGRYEAIRFQPRRSFCRKEHLTIPMGRRSRTLHIERQRVILQLGWMRALCPRWLSTARPETLRCSSNRAVQNVLLNFGGSIKASLECQKCVRRPNTREVGASRTASRRIVRQGGGWQTDGTAVSHAPDGPSHAISRTSLRMHGCLRLGGRESTSNSAWRFT